MADSDLVHICNVAYVLAVPPLVSVSSNPILPIITYAVYDGASEISLVPSDADILRLSADKQIVPHHPKGEYHCEARKWPSDKEGSYKCGDLESDWAFLLFTPLTPEQQKKIQELTGREV